MGYGAVSHESRNSTFIMLGHLNAMTEALVMNFTPPNRTHQTEQHPQAALPLYDRPVQENDQHNLIQHRIPQAAPLKWGSTDSDANKGLRTCRG